MKLKTNEAQRKQWTKNSVQKDQVNLKVLILACDKSKKQKENDLIIPIRTISFFSFKITE
jgi:hypothetical protein